MTRKLRRSVEKAARRKVQEHMQEATNRVLSLGRSCSACGADFDPSQPTNLDTWRVTSYEDRVLLHCPVCQEGA